jgi:HEAT repeat protein
VGISDPAEPTSGRQGRARTERAGEGKEGPASLADLERDLRASRPETRRSAVRKLAALGGRKAWDLVVAALADDESMVADEAQVALGAVDDPKLVTDLLGPAGLRSREAWVRLRVAETLGRLPIEVDAEALARGIMHGDVREAETTRAILWSIERLARA